jgi:hypothetical protein
MDGANHYAERSAVMARDAVCLGIARKYRADNVAFARGEAGRPNHAGLLMALADRVEELGLTLPAGYLSLHLSTLCGKVS